MDDHFTEVAAALEIAMGFWRFAEGKHAINYGLDAMQGDLQPYVREFLPPLEFAELINFGQFNMVNQ